MNAVLFPLVRRSSLRTAAATAAAHWASSTASSAVSQSPTTSNRSIRPFSSVSNAEVDKFGAMDAEWWDPKKNPLIFMNACRVQYIRTVIQQELLANSNNSSNSKNSLPFQGLKALDIGCGGGLLSESLARLGAATTGIDPSARLLAAAVRHSQADPRTRSIVYQETTAEALVETIDADTDTRFDVVCLLEVVEHASDVPSLLQAAAALLKPSGLLFVSTLNRTVSSHVLAIIGAEYVMGYLPVGTHNWNQFRSPDEIAQLVWQEGQLVPVVARSGGGGMGQHTPMGMVLTEPPVGGRWKWKLDPTDTSVNWIGAYRKASVAAV